VRAGVYGGAFGKTLFLWFWPKERGGWPRDGMVSLPREGGGSSGKGEDLGNWFRGR